MPQNSPPSLSRLLAAQKCCFWKNIYPVNEAEAAAEAPEGQSRARRNQLPSQLPLNGALIADANQSTQFCLPIWKLKHKGTFPDTAFRGGLYNIILWAESQMDLEGGTPEPRDSRGINTSYTSLNTRSGEM